MQYIWTILIKKNTCERILFKIDTSVKISKISLLTLIIFHLKKSQEQKKKKISFEDFIKGKAYIFTPFGTHSEYHNLHLGLLQYKIPTDITICSRVLRPDTLEGRFN